MKTECTKIEIINVANTAELYKKYDRQSEPQDVFVELDLRNATLSAAYNPEIGNGVPQAVYHGHVRRYTVPLLTAAAANELLTKIAPIAERVLAGYESVWNGNNFLARLNGDAMKADTELEMECARCDGDHVNVFDAAEWFESDSAASLGITASTTDEELDRIGVAALQQAQANGVHVLENLDEHLRDMRDEAKEAAEND